MDVLQPSIVSIQVTLQLCMFSSKLATTDAICQSNLQEAYVVDRTDLNSFRSLRAEVFEFFDKTYQLT